MTNDPWDLLADDPEWENLAAHLSALDTKAWLVFLQVIADASVAAHRAVQHLSEPTAPQFPGVSPEDAFVLVAEDHAIAGSGQDGGRP